MINMEIPTPSITVALFIEKQRHALHDKSVLRLHSVLGVKPRGPNIIEVGGIHITSTNQLPQALQEKLDNCKYGVIYFTLGSTININGLSESKKNVFSKVLLNLEHAVLWKSPNNHSFSNKTNIITSSWFPQKEILAHPNIVLFISQCGILSVIEAMYAGIPLICIPILGDQHYNGKSIEFNKAGLVLEFNNITEKSLKETINEVLTNNIYKKNAKRISNILKDRPMSPMDTAIYWVEYVIRHKGAPHIKSFAKDLTWYQYLNLDIILIFTFILYIMFNISKMDN